MLVLKLSVCFNLSFILIYKGLILGTDFNYWAFDFISIAFIKWSLGRFAMLLILLVYHCTVCKIWRMWYMIMLWAFQHHKWCCIKHHNDKSRKFRLIQSLHLEYTNTFVAHFQTSHAKYLLFYHVGLYRNAPSWSSLLSSLSAMTCVNIPKCWNLPHDITID